MPQTKLLHTMSAGPSSSAPDGNAAASSSTSFDIATFFPALQAALAQPTQHVNDFPEGDDLKLHRTMDRKLAKRLDATTNRVLGLASRLVDCVAPDGEAGLAEGRNGEASAPAFATVGLKKRKRLQDEDDAVHEFQDQIVEVLDSLLERADINLDTVTGKRKATEISQQADAALASRQKAQDARRGKEAGVLALPDHIINADIPKPQEKFDPPVDNSNDLPPWTPTLPVKHHAMVPLDYIPTPSSSRPASPEIEGTTTTTAPPTHPVGVAEIRGVTVRHPYMYESKHLGYPSSLFTITPPIAPKSFADTPFTWIDTPSGLEAMVEKLQLAQELAVDLEYHSTRSFTGFLCLMQISTREEDFVVDVIRLRKEVREGKLGGVLADPSIIKVSAA